MQSRKWPGDQKHQIIETPEGVFYVKTGVNDCLGAGVFGSVWPAWPYNKKTGKRDKKHPLVAKLFNSQEDYYPAEEIIFAQYFCLQCHPG